MCQVNLLPWRQRRRRRRARAVIIVLAAELLLAFCSTGGSWLRWREEQSSLAARLALLQQQQRHALQQRSEHQQRVAQCARLQDTLKHYRRIRQANQQYYRFFQQLPALLPPGLWLTSLRLREGRLLAGGCSRSYAAIVETNSRLGRHPLLKPAHWHEITRLENGLLRFQLQTPWPGRAINNASR
ncbi:PilN domain-containing protein [Sodalis sp. dw_96]|uniref:PilN domain-containing protein n=1 Tax=Sodalis sp. dw_96 TaxID=2719794 RepID=UPI001BD350A2|nr:PilN domain-containing protein [Sodalis sp. dw_96]